MRATMLGTTSNNDGPLVLMLHGFGVSRHLWNARVEAIAQAGYKTAARNQRGYASTRRRATRRWQCPLIAMTAGAG
jgi:alpha-beta hydrolase superfamily lysophospholipase